MLSEKAILALFDIRDNILAAQLFTAGLSFDKFRDSQLHFYAVTRALEIISEASKRLPDEVRGRHPELPWQDMRDAGNAYRHGYDNVVESIVWKTVQEYLPPLLAVALAEITALDTAK
jgi:uncharacterized protein with HEPN domain